jgi:CHASE3 domain sensor protein
MDERFDELRRELDQKTTEIESLVAEPRRYREYGPF